MKTIYNLFLKCSPEAGIKYFMLGFLRVFDLNEDQQGSGEIVDSMKSKSIKTV